MNEEDIALIRRVRPAERPADPMVKARALARLRREFDSATARRRPLGRRTAAVGLVAAGAALIVVAAGYTGLLDDTPRDDPHAVASGRTPRSTPDVTLGTLELAAAAVERQSTLSRPTRDQWVYTRQLTDFALNPDNSGGRAAEMRGKVTVEEWWKFDGKEMATSVQGSELRRRRILGPGERPRPGHVDPRFNGGAIGGPGVVNRTPDKLYDYVAGLPTDPDALLARIRKDNLDKGQDVTTFGAIAGLFRYDQLIPAKTNAALYRALAKIPGVRVVEDATDYAERHGIGVAFGDQVIVLDFRTYRYMGDKRQALLDSAVVDEPGRRR
ncbi:CU044_5270 family protein [Nonomuraea angiospora]|uniref:CU044_5270 family protein n=1 Tax=Nonomuraea angiospora TaxID=46172 RepID=UPI0034390FA7